LPTDCVVCGLKLVLAPHLARSFHHLFPVPPFAEVPIETELAMTQSSNLLMSGSIKVFAMTESLVADSKDFDRCCFACLKMIGTIIVADTSSIKGRNGKAPVSDAPGDEILRFQCPECQNVFCPDCDAYLHETLHNCPGCLSKSS
jgi:transcription initiation factor TFIIH subunit 2